MSSSIADLVSLFPPDGAAEVGFRQGVVEVWNPAGNTNIVNVGGTLIPDVLYLGIVDSSIGVGSVIGLLRYRSTYFILGRIREI